MKRFRFPAQALLDWRRRRCEATEEELRRLEARRTSALARADSCDAESCRALETLGERRDLTGRALRDADSWREGLALRAGAATEEARRLEAQAVELRARLVKQSHEAELLERLRERRLREHRRAEEKRLERLADELYLATRGRG